MQTQQQKLVKALKRYNDAVALTAHMLEQAKAGGSYAAYKQASDEEYKALLKLNALREANEA